MVSHSWRGRGMNNPQNSTVTQVGPFQVPGPRCVPCTYLLRCTGGCMPCGPKFVLESHTANLLVSRKSARTRRAGEPDSLATRLHRAAKYTDIIDVSMTRSDRHTQIPPSRTGLPTSIKGHPLHSTPTLLLSLLLPPSLPPLGGVSPYGDTSISPFPQASGREHLIKLRRLKRQHFKLHHEMLSPDCICFL